MAERTKRRVMRRGSIPLLVHGLLEYAVALLTIMAPFLFGFDTQAPKVLAVIVGAGLLVLAVVTRYPAGISRTLPLDSHIVLDYVLAIFLIVAPFLFGFTDDDPALAYFLIVGVAHLLVSILTRYHPPEQAARPAR